MWMDVLGEEKKRMATKMDDTIKLVDFDHVREKLSELLIDSPGLSTLFGSREEFAENADWLIANGVTIQKWISVKDRLPNEDDKYFVFKKTAFGCWCDVLGFAKDGRKISRYDFGDQWKNVWYYYDSEYGYGVSENVTHWMPLPEPPSESTVTVEDECNDEDWGC